MDTLASNLDSVFTGYKIWLDKQLLSLEPVMHFQVSAQDRSK